MGAIVTGGGVRFRVWAPTAHSVGVEVNDQRHPLSPEGNGVWSAFVPDIRPGAHYWYVLDGTLKRPDPYSRSQPVGVHGPSEVIDPDAFEWQDEAWRGISIKGLVIYQIHVGTATPDGTFEALIGHLAQLAALGVNAIQLLPVAEFPGERNWGYDGVDLFAVSHVYGGPAGLKRLVDAAHGRGLGVIVDVVYNHFGPDGNYLRDFSHDYFTDRFETSWGEALNYSCDWMRKLVLDNARYWIHEYHVDGLRLDATHAIFDESSPHILAELSQAVRASLPEGREVVLIAETGENDVRYLRPLDEGGFGLDAVYADDFHHILRRYLAGDHEGYYADYEGTLAELARCVEQGWLYEGQPTRRSQRPRGTPARDQPAWQFLYVLQNHDQIGNRAFGERLNHEIDLERFASASALLLFLPYTPMLFMGQEFGASAPFQYFTDHNPELGRLVTEGRRREFQAFSSFADPKTRDEIPDPQAESTFLRSKVHFEEANISPGAELQGLYQRLLTLRRTDPVLAEQAREHMKATALSQDVLAVQRWSGQDERLLLVNFADTEFEARDFRGPWRVVLETTPGSTADAGSIRVPPRSAVIAAR